jgi:microcystin degradation protein MlrC
MTAGMRLRIAVGQIASESNHFVSSPCELDFFRKTGYLVEREALFTLMGADNEVAGMLATLQQAGDVEIIPLLAARANSSGPLSAACYDTLKARLVGPLRAAGPVDGVLLSHHGSMAAEHDDDPEGDIASTVRASVGPRVPIVMTLDLHGNVTRRMVESTNAILGYEHYPHDDVYTTGVRGASLLMRAARGEVRPVIGHAKLPLVLTAFNGSTAGDGPFARLMQQAKAVERAPGVLSASLFFVGSYLDMPDMGCSSLVVADGDPGLAIQEARALARDFWERRRAFAVSSLGVAEAVARGREIEGGPVLLLDTADTTGGGASGDGIGAVEGVLAAGVTEPCLAMVVDPDAVQTCLRHGMGREVSLELGHKLDPRWGTPLRVTGKVLRSLDGHFRYTGGVLGGSWASMGPSVVLQVGSIQILIMSYPTYDWADEQYRAAGLNPELAKFVCVKNMMNFRFGYRDIMKGAFVLDLPGPTPAAMRSLPFRRIARPVFPLDEELTDPVIRTSTSRSA